MSQQGFRVAVDEDRCGRNGMSIWGQLPLAIKLSSADTGGELLIFESRGMGKCGPPRHVHHHQDEWFYAVEGTFVVEVGETRYTLNPGDSLFAPRGVPHAFAHVGDGLGTLITSVSPAGTFEEFIVETTQHPSVPSPEALAAAFTNHDMTILGPPLAID